MYKSVVKIMLKLSRLGQGQNQTIEHDYLRIYCLSTVWWDLARRVGQCGLHGHDQDSYDELGFFPPNAPDVDVIDTSQSLGPSI